MLVLFKKMLALKEYVVCNNSVATNKTIIFNYEIMCYLLFELAVRNVNVYIQQKKYWSGQLSFVKPLLTIFYLS